MFPEVMGLKVTVTAKQPKESEWNPHSFHEVPHTHASKITLHCSYWHYWSVTGRSCIPISAQRPAKLSKHFYYFASVCADKCWVPENTPQSLPSIVFPIQNPRTSRSLCCIAKKKVTTYKITSNSFGSALFENVTHTELLNYKLGRPYEI